MRRKKRKQRVAVETKSVLETRTNDRAKASASAKVSAEISSDSLKILEVPEMEAGLDSFECKVSVVGIVHHSEENDAYVELKVFNNVTHEFDTEELSLANLGSKTFKRLLVGKGYSQKVAKAMGETVQKNVYAILALDDRSQIKEAHTALGWFRIDGGMVFKADQIYNLSEAINSEYIGKYTIVSQGSLAAFRQMLDDYVKENTALKAVCGMAVAATVLPFANLMWGAGIDNLINHLMGTSSTGKSTAAMLFVAFGSVPFGLNSMILTFLSTDNALLSQVSDINGYPVAIEELSTSGGKKLTELMYSLANGSGKIRCVAGGTGLSKESRFSTVFLSNGETSTALRN